MKAMQPNGRFLRRKNGEPHVYHWTEQLAKHDDMLECDEQGNLVYTGQTKNAVELQKPKPHVVVERAPDVPHFDADSLANRKAQSLATAEPTTATTPLSDEDFPVAQIDVTAAIADEDDAPEPTPEPTVVAAAAAVAKPEPPVGPDPNDIRYWNKATTLERLTAAGVEITPEIRALSTFKLRGLYKERTAHAGQ